MHFEFQLVIELLTLGLITGFLAGLLGIGGGMLMGPFITLILSARGLPPDLAVKVAIATSMTTIVFTSLSSLYAHHRRGAVRWDIVKGLAPGLVLGGVLGSMQLFAILKGSTLALIFAAFIGLSATQMLRNKQPNPKRNMPGFAGKVAVGGMIGLASSLVGAGGGFLSVPFMVAHHVVMVQALGTSAALGFPIALSTALGYAIAGQDVAGLPPGTLGYIWLPALGLIASASVLTAPQGAKLAHKLPMLQLKRIFACILYLLAAYMLWKGLSCIRTC
jgi:uncharacterized membrane protein YfcA